MKLAQLSQVWRFSFFPSISYLNICLPSQQHVCFCLLLHQLKIQGGLWPHVSIIPWGGVELEFTKPTIIMMHTVPNGCPYLLVRQLPLKDEGRGLQMLLQMCEAHQLLLHCQQTMCLICDEQLEILAKDSSIKPCCMSAEKRRSRLWTSRLSLQMRTFLTSYPLIQLGWNWLVNHSYLHCCQLLASPSLENHCIRAPLPWIPSRQVSEDVMPLQTSTPQSGPWD